MMPIVDCHAFFGAPPESIRRGTLEEVETVLGQAKIQFVLLASAQADSGDFRRGNEALQKAVSGRDGVAAWACVNPSYPEESITDLRRRLGRPEFVGTKLPRDAAGERIASEGFRNVLNATLRYGLPVLIDTASEQDIRDVVALAGEFHSLKFLLGGMGETAWETAIRACEPVLNTFLDIGSTESDRDKLADAVAAVSPRRLLFGSHFPRLHPMYVLGMVGDSEISDRDRERILWRNAVELFRLELPDEPLGQRSASGAGSAGEA